jgi:hypothetical protein
LTTPSLDDAAKDDDLDFELFGIFAAAGSDSGFGDNLTKGGASAAS